MKRTDLRTIAITYWKHIAGITAVLAIAAAGVFAYASGSDRQFSDREKVVATVNGQPISVKRFNESYVNFLITTGKNDTEENRIVHLNSLIDTYLLAEEAERRGLDENDVYRAFYDRKLEHTVGGQYYYEVFLDTLAPLSDAEIRQAFKRSKEKVVIRHLLFQEPAEADQAYERLVAGEDFVQLANEVYQTSEFDSLAGFLGVAGYWELDDAFAEVAFSQPVGVPSQPVRTRYGYHIILKEDHLYNPLLTESEYTYRREGVSQQAHMRKMRLEGSRFIHDYMTSLNVEVDEEAVLALRDAINRLSVEPNENTHQPPARLSTEEVGSLMQSFTPETAILTYELDGETRTFTALEYYKWLPELPFDEARGRTAASVGRALRNEVLAVQGFEENLHEHEVVTEFMQYASNVYLAAELREQLRQNEKAEPTEEEIREAFDRFSYRTLKKAAADFWAVSFEEYEQARQALDRIEEGADPASFPTYEYYQNQDLRPLRSLGGHVRRALLDRPLLVGAGDGEWYVIQVDEREVEWTTIEEKRDEIAGMLATYMPEARLAGDLRESAEVWIDTTLFREMMDLR